MILCLILLCSAVFVVYKIKRFHDKVESNKFYNELMKGKKND